MLNVHSAGKEPYLSAYAVKPRTFYENLILFVLVLIDVVKVIAFTAFEVMKLPFVCLEGGPKEICGQTALITGGANGIGRAIALELAKNGCNIIIADVDEKASEKTLAMLKEYDVKAIAFTTDVSNPKEVAILKESIEASPLESVDILVNNAGLMPLISLREGTPADVERIVDVNLNANFWTVRAFLQDMISQRTGHIVQISSMSARHPIAGACIYTATKFAVTGFMLALEEELRQEGLGDCIDFSIVYPYFVSTRRDLMNILNLRFPAITAQQTAKATVRGIISRQRHVVIPSFDGILAAFVQSLPHTVQCLVRDYILREPESRVIKNPYLYVG